tara:strand:- start:491 stop:688 length:198 start_codon:yes stop_codon:yes gene_type:complete
MALTNSEVLENLKKSKAQVEVQMEELRAAYYKIIGSIDVLEQIENSNSEETEEPAEEPAEESIAE